MTRHFSMQLLRQVSDTLSQLRGREVRDAVMRSDLRQLKVELSDGAVVVVAVGADESGQPRAQGPQLEVRFDTA